MTNEMLYTVKQASEVLGTNVSYVYKLIDAGQIRAMKLGAVKIRKEELLRFVTEAEGKDYTDPYNVKVMA